MSESYLFAETPRAGNLGHRYLLSPGVSASTTRLAEIVGLIDEPVVFGEDFIAVSQLVSQKLESGTVRTGREMLVLVGVNGATLPPSTLTKMVARLHACADSLEQLVTVDIDWTTLSETDLIYTRLELGDWQKSLNQVLSPIGPSGHANRDLKSGSQETPEFRPQNQSRLTRFVKCLCLSVALLAVGGVGGFIAGRTLKGESPVTEHKPQNQGDRSAPIQKGPPQINTQPPPQEQVVQAEAPVARSPHTQGTNSEYKALRTLINGAVEEQNVSRLVLLLDYVQLLPGQEQQEVVSDPIVWSFKDHSDPESKGKLYHALKMHVGSLIRDDQYWQELIQILKDDDKKLYSRWKKAVEDPDTISAHTAAGKYLKNAPWRSMEKVVESWLEESGKQNQLKLQVSPPKDRSWSITFSSGASKSEVTLSGDVNASGQNNWSIDTAFFAPSVNQLTVTLDRKTQSHISLKKKRPRSVDFEDANGARVEFDYPTNPPSPPEWKPNSKESSP